MATPDKLEYLATMNWLKPCQLGELAPDAPETSLLVERWRLRRGGSWKRALAGVGTVAACQWSASHIFGFGSGGVDDPTPAIMVIAMMVGLMVESWWVQRMELRQARQWTSRIGRTAAVRVEDLLGRRVMGAAALAMAAQAVAIVAVVVERGVRPGAAMLSVAAVFWMASIVRARAAAARPMIAIDDRSRIVDDWIRTSEVMGSFAPGVLGSFVLLAGFDVPTQPALVMGFVSAAVALVAGTERGRTWLNGLGSTDGGVR